MFKKPCPCGCGIKLGRSERRKVEAIQVIDARVDTLSSKTLPEYTSATSAERAAPLRKFIQDGRDISGRLNAEVHGGNGPQMMQYIKGGPVNPRLSRAWVLSAGDIESASPEALARLLAILSGP